MAWRRFEDYAQSRPLAYWLRGSPATWSWRTIAAGTNAIYFDASILEAIDERMARIDDRKEDTWSDKVAALTNVWTCCPSPCGGTSSCSTRTPATPRRLPPKRTRARGGQEAAAKGPEAAGGMSTPQRAVPPFARGGQSMRPPEVPPPDHDIPIAPGDSENGNEPLGNVQIQEWADDRFVHALLVGHFQDTPETASQRVARVCSAFEKSVGARRWYWRAGLSTAAAAVLLAGLAVFFWPAKVCNAAPPGSRHLRHRRQNIPNRHQRGYRPARPGCEEELDASSRRPAFKPARRHAVAKRLGRALCTSKTASRSSRTLCPQVARSPEAWMNPRAGSPVPHAFRHIWQSGSPLAPTSGGQRPQPVAGGNPRGRRIAAAGRSARHVAPAPQALRRLPAQPVTLAGGHRAGLVRGGGSRHAAGETATSHRAVGRG